MKEFIEQLEALLYAAHELDKKITDTYTENDYLRNVNERLEQENKDLIEELKDREREILECEAELRERAADGDYYAY